MTPKINRITLYRIDVPLLIPYRLSFGPQAHFECVIVHTELDDGTTGWGEAALLPGYTDETAEQSWKLALQLSSKLVDVDVCSARELLLGLLPAKAFTAAAFLTALDQASGHPSLNTAGRMRLLGTVNGKSDDLPALESEIESLLKTGYQTLKVKVGWDLKQDLAAVSTIKSIVAGRAVLRVDANQGFNVADGCHFVSKLDPEGIELVEQPCDAHDWDAASLIKQAANMPIMLDEQIYGIADIRRAADLGCADYIKLKLMKMGSLDNLTEGLLLISELGMRPVLGNGVATGLGCWMEACVGAEILDNAGEMNGFLKARECFLTTPLQMDGDSIILSGHASMVDIDRLTSMAQYVSDFGALASSPP